MAKLEIGSQMADLYPGWENLTLKERVWGLCLVATACAATGELGVMAVVDKLVASLMKEFEEEQNRRDSRIGRN